MSLSSQVRREVDNREANKNKTISMLRASVQNWTMKNRHLRTENERLKRVAEEVMRWKYDLTRDPTINAEAKLIEMEYNLEAYKQAIDNLMGIIQTLKSKVEFLENHISELNSSVR